MSEEKQNQRGPENFITKKFFSNRVTLPKNQRVAPGNKTYASAAKYGENIMVIGDNHLKRMKQNLFNNVFENAKKFIKYFGGTKSEHMKHYV